VAQDTKTAADKKESKRAAKARERVTEIINKSVKPEPVVPIPGNNVVTNMAMVLPGEWVRLIDEQLRIGRRQVLPEETYAIECNAEWHFARYNGEGGTLCSAVYNTAYRFTLKYPTFYCSAPQIAEFLNANIKTVQAAIDLLVLDGFFEHVTAEPGKAYGYRAVSHKDWRAKHNLHANEPDHADHVNYCAYRNKLPEYMQGDELGKKMFAISSACFRPYAAFLVSFRETGQSDDAIAKHWRTFLETNKPTGRQWYTIAKTFRAYLDAHMPNDGF
jgi:hypothetical protein